MIKNGLLRENSKEDCWGVQHEKGKKERAGPLDGRGQKYLRGGCPLGNKGGARKKKKTWGKQKNSRDEQHRQKVLRGGSKRRRKVRKKSSGGTQKRKAREGMMLTHTRCQGSRVKQGPNSPPRTNPL